MNLLCDITMNMLMRLYVNRRLIIRKLYAYMLTIRKLYVNRMICELEYIMLSYACALKIRQMFIFQFVNARMLIYK